MSFRPVSFLKGTLVIGVPSLLVPAITRIDARRHGDEWAVCFGTDGEPIVAKGHYRQEGPDIVATGGRASALPAWWPDGRAIYPEPWNVARMFGHGPVIELPMEVKA